MTIESLNKELNELYKGIYCEKPFSDFLKLVQEKPTLFIRSSVEYLYDAFTYSMLKANEKNIWNGFGDKKNVLYGIETVINELYRNIKTFAKESSDNRLFLLYGPAGIGKTTIIKLLIRALEKYSNTDEGSLYKLVWSDKKGKKFSCYMRDNPLFIYPKEYREKFFAELGIEPSGRFLRGDLCPNCHKIKETIIREVGFNKLFDYIQPRRFTFSEAFSKGIAFIPEGELKKFSRTDLKEEIINFSISERGLEIKIWNLQNKWTNANRGLLHISELCKNEPQALNCLLTPIQDMEKNMGDFNILLDTVFFATTNTEDYDSFWGAETNAGLRGRILRTVITSLTNFKDEEKAYRKEIASYQLKSEKNEKHQMPHSLEMLALWSVATRLRQAQEQSYREDKLPKGLDGLAYKIVKLSNLEKALLYADVRNAKIDNHMYRQDVLNLIKEEFKDVEDREGLMGAPFRFAQDVISKAISMPDSSDHLSVFVLFNALEECIVEGKHKFLEKQKEPYEKYLKEVKGYYDNLVINEVTVAFGPKEEILKKEIGKYVENLVAFTKQTPPERYHGTLEQRLHSLEQDLLEFEEKRVNITKYGEKKEDFRTRVITTSEERYKLVTELVDKIKNNIESIKRGEVGLLLRALNSYGNESFKNYDEGIQEKITNAMGNMLSLDFDGSSYCFKCAKDTIKYVLTKLDQEEKKT